MLITNTETTRKSPTNEQEAGQENLHDGTANNQGNFAENGAKSQAVCIPQNTPDELKPYLRFVVWALSHDPSKPKPDKVPFDPKTLKLASVGNRLTWGTFEQACQVYDKRKGKHFTFRSKDGTRNGIFSGIGFVLDEELGLVGVDLDGCVRPDGSLEPWAQEFVDVLNTYTEVSPSGTGLRLFVFATLPKGRRRKGKIELYTSGRYLTLTGNIYGEKKPIAHRQNEIASLYEKHFSAPKTKPVQTQFTPPATLSDAELLGVAFRSKNGAEIKALYEGDMSRYSSQSEADLALCSSLAFYTQKDESRMDSLFRSSGLMRPKWDELHGNKTYGMMTIEQAIATCASVYSPEHRRIERGGAIVDKLPDWIIEKEDRKGNVTRRVSAPRLYAHIKKICHYKIAQDDAKTARHIFWWGNGKYNLVSPEQIKGYVKGIIEAYDPDLISNSVHTEVFNLLNADTAQISLGDMDADETIVNFTNGILDIETLQLRPATPQDLCSIQLPLAWDDTQVHSPVYDKYALTLTDGCKDFQTLLLEYMGVIFSNIQGHRAKKALFLVGDSNTGKSRAKILTERILGRGLYSAVDLATLEGRFGTSNVYRKRLVGQGDMSYVKVKELKVFKELTGGDSVDCEFKGENIFPYTFRGLLWYCTNKLPKFGGDQGEPVFNRMIVCYCKNIIPKNEQDGDLVEKMYAERQAIVVKAILAAREFVKRGYKFTIPAHVQPMIDQWRESNNSALDFFNECCQFRNEGQYIDGVTTKVLFNFYKAFCADSNNGYFLPLREFKESLAEFVGVDVRAVVTKKQGYTYYPITLTQQGYEDYRRSKLCEEFSSMSVQTQQCIPDVQPIAYSQELHILAGYKDKETFWKNCREGRNIPCPHKRWTAIPKTHCEDCSDVHKDCIFKHLKQEEVYHENSNF